LTGADHWSGGRVILITGATGDLGKVVAGRFAAAGDRLALAGTNLDRLTEVGGELGLKADRWLPVVGDMRQADEARTVAGAVRERFERIDALVHLIGGWAGGTPVVDLDPDELTTMLDQHLWTTLHMVQAVVPGMVEAGWGRVVAIMARAGLEASAKVSSYGIAKAAEDTLLRSLARELAGTGVTVNLVTVGTIDEEHQRDAAPTARNATWTTPEEIAAAIAYLCSDEADSITGARLPLDRRA
jgi:NAD(P)-dependent dehydrogenase (short-subunit alcohol dehydrogenase family)